MGTGKTYSTKYLLDSNNSSGVAGQVLSTTSTGIDWVNANTVPGAGLWLENGNDIYNSNSADVGIGITNPSGKFHVYNAAAHNNIYFTGGDVGGTGYDINLYINGGANNSEMSINMGIAGNADRDRIKTYQGNMYFRTNDSERMTINSSGNVGITAAAYLGFNGAGDASHSIAYNAGIDGVLLRGQNGVVFGTGGGATAVERVRITSSGNVGIGTGANVYGDLHLLGGQQDIVLTNTAADGVAGLTISRIIGQARGYSNNGAVMQSIDFETNSGFWYKGDIVFKTNNTDGTDTTVAASERMRIKADGSINIGSRRAALPSNFGYSGSYKVLILGSSGANYQTDAVTLSLGVDVTGNPSGSFNGNGREIIIRNEGAFISPNAANNGYNTILGWNSSGQPHFNQNVGIGSVTPRDKLTVFTAGTAEEEIGLRLVNPIGFTNAGSGASIIFAQDRNVGENLPMAKIRSSQSIAGTSSYGDLIFSTLSSTMQDRMTILSGGNVGIGDTSPQGKLEVSQNMSNGAASAFTSPHLRLSSLNTTDSTGFVGMTFATSSANNYGFSWGALRTTSALGGMHLRYHGNSASGTDIFNIDYTGNVTIASTRYIRSDSSSGYLTIQGGATFPGGRIDMYGGSNASAGIEFLTGGATGSTTLRLRIDGDTDDSYFTGNLGIGTTSPDKLLHVGDGAASLASPQGAEIEGYNNTLDVKTNEANNISDFTAALNLYCDGVAGSSGTGTGIYFRAKTGGGGGGEYTKGRIQGAVYTSWTTNTDATRTSKLVIQTTNSGTHADRVTILGTGATTFVSTVTATNFILSSDEALKENIKDISNKHIDVNWKNFELKSEPGVKRSGVIAQELEKKHPEFVRTNEDGLKSVAYIDLLIAKIAELEARLEKAGL